MTDSKVQESDWHIGSRILPVPVGASDILQNAILTSPVPDVAASREAVPKNEAEWLTNIAERDKETAAGVKNLIAQSPISVKGEEIQGAKIFHITPDEVDPRHDDHLFIFIHGGSYIRYGGEAGLKEGILIALRTKMPVLSIDYRMPPHHPFPAGLEDVLTVYKHLLRHRTAQSMVMGGSSAGGGLTLAAVHKLIQLNLAVPGALFAGTPWADLTKTGDSYWINEGIDKILVSYHGILGASARLYAGDHDLKDPLLSPIYGDFQGFPPTYLVTGTRDLFLSNTARTHTKLRAAGVVADLMVYEGVAHGDYFFETDSPESRQTYGELNAFLLQHLK